MLRIALPLLGFASPSSRRAWIEMMMSRVVFCTVFVALLAEGVDRNYDEPTEKRSRRRSPSSRRAWIEILTRYPEWTAKEGRPPRGGRG